MKVMGRWMVKESQRILLVSFRNSGHGMKSRKREEEEKEGRKCLVGPPLFLSHSPHPLTPAFCFYHLYQLPTLNPCLRLCSQGS